MFHILPSLIIMNTVRPYFGVIGNRSKYLSKLSLNDEGSNVRLFGWIKSIRKISKSLSFLTLHDSTGKCQLIIRGGDNNKKFESLLKLPIQSVISVDGLVKRLKSDDGVEIEVQNFECLNKVRSLPFDPFDETVNEDLKFKHRYLDLRSSYLTNNLQKRSNISHFIRNFLHSNHFTEIETPILLKSTPEGAREFLVPTRTSHEPSFYALPQSPQQPKQLIISSGAVDNYYQLAKCFRDEDGRKDRQPEFTQLDIEMAFVNGSPSNSSSDWNCGGEQVRNLIENLIKSLWSSFQSTQFDKPFKVLKYKDAMNKYGSDKPDLRFNLEIQTAQENHQDGTQIRALVYKPSTYGKLKEDNLLKTFPSTPLNEISDSIKRLLNIENDDIVWLEQSPLIPQGSSTKLGNIRLQLFNQLRLNDQLQISDNHYEFLWVIEFPLFTKSDDDKNLLAKGRWASTHHPFTAPYAQDLDLLDDTNSIHKIRGQHYDLVLNGIELGGGSVRIHDSDLQYNVFKNVLNLSDDEISRFDHLLSALKVGAPPHAGIALGFDRLIALMCGTNSIKDVIAFPKSLNGFDPVFKSPSSINDTEIYEYRLKSIPKSQ